MNTYQHFINGIWTPSTSGKTFLSLNPATEQPLGKFQQGNAADVHRAVNAATRALPSWKATPAPVRGELLLEIALLLKKNKQRLGKLVTQEMGKVLKEGLGDVQEAIDTFEYFAGEGRRLFGYTTPSELPQKFCFTLRQPLGVVGLITPWNFPTAIPAWKLAPALICGNTVAFKPASDTPLCAIELVKILEEAGLPKGVVNMVTGSGEEAGSPIIKNPAIRGISFTGSKSTGEYITQHAGIKKIGLELGGKNAILVLDDADLDLAVDGILWGAFGTTGQRCTATSRVIVQKNIQRQLEENLLKRTKKLHLGDGLKETTVVGPLINKKAVEKTQNYINLGKKEGAVLLCGGSSGKGKGFFYQPTIFTKVKPTMHIAQEEIFGPVLSILTAENLRDAIKICNNIEYGLSSALYTKNITYAMQAIEHIESGITYINSSTIGAEVHLPFGGVKGTGNGTREAGIEGIHEFSETKTVYIDYSNKLQKAQGID